jgi:hypothetical protein
MLHKELEEALELEEKLDASLLFVREANRRNKGQKHNE